MPVVMPLTLVHPRTQYSLNLTATIKNCSAQLEQPAPPADEGVL